MTYSNMKKLNPQNKHFSTFQLKRSKFDRMREKKKSQLVVENLAMLMENLNVQALSIPPLETSLTTILRHDAQKHK